MTRMVMCVKLGRELPGLDEPPFGGELGERIYNHISEHAWGMWPQHQMILINHYGLTLNDPNARQFLREQMEEFFFSEEAKMPEGWVPEGAPGAAPAKGGGPARKK